MSERCCENGCNREGYYQRSGLRYCLRHLRESVEDEHERAKNKARERIRPRPEAAAEMRDLFAEIEREIAKREGVR